MYKILKQTGNEDIILRQLDNACIPLCEDNKDYKEYLEWVAEGNVAEVVVL